MKKEIKKETKKEEKKEFKSEHFHLNLEILHPKEEEKVFEAPIISKKIYAKYAIHDDEPETETSDWRFYLFIGCCLLLTVGAALIKIYL